MESRGEECLPRLWGREIPKRARPEGPLGCAARQQSSGRKPRRAFSDLFFSFMKGVARRVLALAREKGNGLPRQGLAALPRNDRFCVVRTRFTKRLPSSAACSRFALPRKNAHPNGAHFLYW